MSESAQAGSSNAVLDQAAQLLPTQPRRVEEAARDVLREYPNHPRATLLLGMAHRAQGALDSAIDVLLTLVRVHPKFPAAHYELGVALGMAGRAPEALAALSRAVQLKPDIGEGWRLIADLLIRLGDPASADRAYGNHLAVSTGNPKLLKAAAALCEERLAEAEALLLVHLDAHRTDVAAMKMLAEVVARAGRFEDAERVLGQCLELAPGYKAARYSRAAVLRNLGRNSECFEEMTKLIAVDPRNPTYLNLRANALTGIGEYEQAIADFATVLGDYPGNARIWLAYGHALRTAGRTAECVDAYRRSIEHAPSLGEPYWSLANMKTFRFSDTDVETMRTQLEKPDLPDEDRAHFHFALGKALEDRRSFDAAFNEYDAGNRVRRRGVTYSADDTSRFVERSKALFTAEFFRERAGWGCADPAPIFVIGLPRAGSTLVEQILSSHSTVEGTMELPDVAQVARSIVDDPRNKPRILFPEVLVNVARDEFAAFGERYLQQTQVQRKLGVPHFIDKMPNNWMHAGFLHLMLPNAKIVDARRHPMSCCFSIFKQLFARGQQFAYDFDDLARYYRDYVELMAHLDEVLPGRIHRVVYERMVDDTESEIRRLLEYCGLPFEDACLRFYENDRAVRTPSSEQVRRPIFRDGVEQWHKFERWLEPLAKALGPVLDAYPEVPKKVRGEG